MLGLVFDFGWIEFPPPCSNVVFCSQMGSVDRCQNIRKNMTCNLKAVRISAEGGCKKDVSCGLYNRSMEYKDVSATITV